MVTEHRLSAWSILYQLVEKPSCAAPFGFSYPSVAQALVCPGTDK
jgi:hypothetical protein